MNALRLLSPVRAATGVVRLVRPDVVVPGLVGGPLGPGARRVVRVLGVRQLAQAWLTARNPTPAVLRLGVEVDLAHAVSMIGLAAVSRRYRTGALGDAALAAALVVVGIRAAREASTPAFITDQH